VTIKLTRAIHLVLRGSLSVENGIGCLLEASLFNNCCDTLPVNCTKRCRLLRLLFERHSRAAGASSERSISVTWHAGWLASHRAHSAVGAPARRIACPAAGGVAAAGVQPDECRRGTAPCAALPQPFHSLPSAWRRPGQPTGTRQRTCQACPAMAAAWVPRLFLRRHGGGGAAAASTSVTAFQQNWAAARCDAAGAGCRRSRRSAGARRVPCGRPAPF